MKSPECRVSLRDARRACVLRSLWRSTLRSSTAPTSDWTAFCRDLEAGAPRALYREAGQVDLRDSPVPRYDLLDLNAYTAVYMQFSRGCPYCCGLDSFPGSTPYPCAATPTISSSGLLRWTIQPRSWAGFSSIR